MSATAAPGAHARPYASALEQRLTAPQRTRPFYLNHRDESFMSFGFQQQQPQHQHQQSIIQRHFLEPQPQYRGSSASKVPDASSLSPVSALLEPSFYDTHHHHSGRQAHHHILQQRQQTHHHHPLHNQQFAFEKDQTGKDSGVSAATALLAEYCFEPVGPKAVKLEPAEEPSAGAAACGEASRIGPSPPASETGSGSNLEDLDGLTDLLPLQPDFRVDVGCIKDVVETGWGGDERAATTSGSSLSTPSSSTSSVTLSPMTKAEPPPGPLSSMFPQVAKQSAPSIGGGLAESAPFSAMSSALHGDAVYQDWLDQIIHI